MVKWCQEPITDNPSPQKQRGSVREMSPPPTLVVFLKIFFVLKWLGKKICGSLMRVGGPVGRSCMDTPLHKVKPKHGRCGEISPLVPLNPLISSIFFVKRERLIL